MNDEERLNKLCKEACSEVGVSYQGLLFEQDGDSFQAYLMFTFGKNMLGMIESKGIVKFLDYPELVEKFKKNLRKEIVQNLSCKFESLQALCLN